MGSSASTPANANATASANASAPANANASAPKKNVNATVVQSGGRKTRKQGRKKRHTKKQMRN
jgi:hypothetical protein